MKKSNNQLAKLAASLKKKTTPAAPVAQGGTKMQKAPAAAAAQGGAKSQNIVRVSETLMAHANTLALDLQDAVREASKDMSVTISPNRVLLVALLRWTEVTEQDREDIERRGSDDKDTKSKAMWLPISPATQKHLSFLQRQFVLRGVLIAKTGCNEPAIARQALWRWERITPQDVKFYQSLPVA